MCECVCKMWCRAQQGRADSRWAARARWICRNGEKGWIRHQRPVRWRCSRSGWPWDRWVQVHQLKRARMWICEFFGDYSDVTIGSLWSGSAFRHAGIPVWNFVQFSMWIQSLIAPVWWQCESCLSLVLPWTSKHLNFLHAQKYWKVVENSYVVHSLCKCARPFPLQIWNICMIVGSLCKHVTHLRCKHFVWMLIVQVFNYKQSSRTSNKFWNLLPRGKYQWNRMLR